MNISNEQYSKMVSDASSPSPIVKDMAAAFFVGGGICVLGQLLLTAFKATELTLETSKSLVSVTLIFIAAVLTGLGVFDNIAKFAGAGTLVPITGFANAVCSPAIDSRAEGYILGVASKMFVIAGPVIVYGTVSSVIYGVIYYLMKML